MKISELPYLRKEVIAQKLLDVGYKESDIGHMTKLELINLVKQELLREEVLSIPTEKEDSESPIVEQAVISTSEITNPTATTTITSAENTQIPSITDPDWSDYVLSLFTDREKIDNYPTCDGLRRIFEKLIGPIIDCQMTVVQPAFFDNNNRATVQCNIKYFNRNIGTHCSVSDVADCSDRNTEHPYNLYPTATAATVAEGRALRKALRLKTLVREEVMRPDDKTIAIQREVDIAATPITESQRIMIPKMSKLLGISVEKLLKYMNKSITPDLLSYSDAQDIILKLHNYSKTVSEGGEIIPEEIINATTNS